MVAGSYIGIGTMDEVSKRRHCRQGVNSSEEGLRRLITVTQPHCQGFKQLQQRPKSLVFGKRKKGF